MASDQTLAPESIVERVFAGKIIFSSVRAPWTPKLLLAWLKNEKNLRVLSWEVKGKNLILIKAESSSHLYCVLSGE
jgi:hypothetical protein